MSCARAISLGSALTAAALLAGCNDLYTDRRDRIWISAGDAVATNKMTQMVDPWPRASANRNIAFNGEKMESAVARYRQNKVTAPVNATTSSTPYQQVQPIVLSPGKP
jgi:hypothetical protein